MLKFYFSPFGRISRKEFWLRFILPYFVFTGVLSFALLAPEPALRGNDPQIAASAIAEKLILLSPIFLPVWWVSFVMLVKRLHDRGISGLWILVPLSVVALVNGVLLLQPQILDIMRWPFLIFLFVSLGIDVWLFVNAYFLRGMRDDNKFGPDPLVADERVVE